MNDTQITRLWDHPNCPTIKLFHPWPVGQIWWDHLNWSRIKNFNLCDRCNAFTRLTVCYILKHDKNLISHIQQMPQKKEKNIKSYNASCIKKNAANNNNIKHYHNIAELANWFQLLASLIKHLTQYWRIIKVFCVFFLWYVLQYVMMSTRSRAIRPDGQMLSPLCVT